MFEPFFDQYLPSVTFNGGKPVYVPLHPPVSTIQKPTSNDWTIDVDELRYALLFKSINVQFRPLIKSCNHPAHQDDHCQHTP